MGTRADFYVGRGEDAEWLGSVAMDGYPTGVFGEGDIQLPGSAVTEDRWRAAVAEFLAKTSHATVPDQGWPWPWDDSGTTDFAYALDGGTVYASCFGHKWFDARDPDYEVDWDAGKVAAFPDMSAVKNVTRGKRSGAIFIGRGSDGRYGLLAED